MKHSLHKFVFWELQEECRPGYFGHHCRAKCMYPYYGVECESQCSCSEHQCNATTGCSTSTFGMSSEIMLLFLNLQLIYIKIILYPLHSLLSERLGVFEWNKNNSKQKGRYDWTMTIFERWRKDIHIHLIETRISSLEILNTFLLWAMKPTLKISIEINILHICSLRWRPKYGNVCNAIGNGNFWLISNSIENISCIEYMIAKRNPNKRRGKCSMILFTGISEIIPLGVFFSAQMRVDFIQKTNV